MCRFRLFIDMLVLRLGRRSVVYGLIHNNQKCRVLGIFKGSLTGLERQYFIGQFPTYESYSILNFSVSQFLFAVQHDHRSLDGIECVKLIYIQSQGIRPSESVLSTLTGSSSLGFQTRSSQPSCRY